MSCTTVVVPIYASEVVAGAVSKVRGGGSPGRRCARSRRTYVPARGARLDLAPLGDELVLAVLLAHGG